MEAPEDPLSSTSLSSRGMRPPRPKVWMPAVPVAAEPVPSSLNPHGNSSTRQAPATPLTMTLATCRILHSLLQRIMTDTSSAVRVLSNRTARPNFPVVLVFLIPPDRRTSSAVLRSLHRPLPAFLQ